MSNGKFTLLRLVGFERCVLTIFDNELMTQETKFSEQ
jgi:hypothetical protein